MTVSAERLAAVIVVILGMPFMFMLARGFAEGEQLRREIPVRAILGDAAFEALREGETPPLGYMGNNRTAPDFELVDKHGATWKLSDQRGKTVVMNFWTVTCQPCIEEMPSLEQLALVAESRDDLEVVAITTDAGWDDVKGVFGPKSKLRVLFDPDGKIVRDVYGTRLFPETWVVDGDGVIRLRVDGKRDWSSPVTLDAIEGV